MFGDGISMASFGFSYTHYYVGITNHKSRSLLGGSDERALQEAEREFGKNVVVYADRITVTTGGQRFGRVVKLRRGKNGEVVREI